MSSGRFADFAVVLLSQDLHRVTLRKPSLRCIADDSRRRARAPILSRFESFDRDFASLFVRFRAISGTVVRSFDVDAYELRVNHVAMFKSSNRSTVREFCVCGRKAAYVPDLVL